MTAFGIDVRSEVGRLRQVLVHRPGDEIVRMTHGDLSRLLFDDILSPAKAAREHALLCSILEAAGAEVLELRTLLGAALAEAPTVERERLVARCCGLAGVDRLAPALAALEPARLAEALIAGVSWADLPEAPQSLARLRAEHLGRADALPPVPNLMFMRDPCISIHERAVSASMATNARAREPLLVRFALRWGAGGSDQQLVGGLDPGDGHHIEGGDVLVLSELILMIGCSERTTASGIQALAEDVLFPGSPTLQRVYAVLMPEDRSVMHLDTILTQIDRDLFLGHAPLVCAPPDRGGAPVVVLERGRPPRLVRGASVQDVLRDELGPATAVVPAGGHDPLHQQREQWTDGANAVCTSPGHAVLYSRNTYTVATLRDEHGFGVVELTTALRPEERAARLAEGLELERCVFGFSGSELSRGRGGGRCLTMPLRREPTSAEA